MKRFAVLALAALLILPVYAHGGRTDANGGHYDSSTGEYHYHHGYPAHQHVNGTCPYNFDDKTDIDSEYQSSKNSTLDDKSETKKQKSDKTLFVVSWVAVILFIILPLAHFLYMAFAIIKRKDKNKYENQQEKSIKNSSIKNKIIIGWTTIIFSIAIVPVFNYCMMDIWSFNWVNPENILQSIPGMIAIWFIFGMIPTSTSMFFSLLICSFLHRREDVAKKNKNTTHESEMYFGAFVGFIGTYTFLLIYGVMNILIR